MIHLHHQLERQREHRRRLRAREHLEHPQARPLLLSVRPGDDADLVRLAALNEVPTPSGPQLVASVDGEVIAARGLEDERLLTDPFRRTDHLVQLLTLHARGILAGRPA